MPALQSPTFVYRCLKAGLNHSPNLQVFKLGSHRYTQPLTQKAERDKTLLLGCLNWISRVTSSLWHSQISLILTILQMIGQEDLHLHIKQHSFQAELKREMNLHRCIPTNPTCYSLTLGHQHLTNIYPVEITVQRFLQREAKRKDVNKAEMQVKGSATHSSSLFKNTF